jgi:hypothetical protein
MQLTHLPAESIISACSAIPENRHDNPRLSRIVSLYDLVKPFTAGRYLLAVNHLSDLVSQLRHVGDKLDGERLKDTLKKTPDAFRKLKGDCEDLEVRASLATIEKILTFFKQADPGKFKAEHIQDLLDEFIGRMGDELHGRECFLLTLSEARYYKEPRKGWETIIARFPDTATDIQEASRCFAVSRYTAAVFHSLLVVEIGLIELGRFIGVHDPKSGWTAVANRLEAIVRTDYPKRSDFEKDNEMFLEQVRGTTAALKNAWRNKINHVQDRLVLIGGEEFAPDTAEEILFATRGFMKRLAEGLPPRQDVT